MRILVVTVYEGITNHDVHDWAERVFAKTVAGQFSPKQMDEMKKDFLNGKDVMAQSKSPDGKQSQTTKWRLSK
jgi:hypothetical protein